MSLREQNARVAIGDALRKSWTSANTAGYTPNADPSASGNIRLTLGNYDQDYPDPQIALTDVSSARVDQSWKPDGSGLVNTHDSRVDANVYTGTEDDLPEHNQLLAEAIGWEVYDILHDLDRLVDPVTSGLMVEAVDPLSEPVVGVDTDGPETKHRALIELGFTRSHQPDG